MKGEMIITITGNFSIRMTRDCQMLINTCMHVKPYRTAIYKYSITKGQMKILDNEMDYCEYLAKSTKKFKDAYKYSGFPLKCPVQSVSF